MSQYYFINNPLIWQPAGCDQALYSRSGAAVTDKAEAGQRRPVICYGYVAACSNAFRIKRLQTIRLRNTEVVKPQILSNKP